MQDVHTFRRLGVPFTIARRGWMFGFQRREVRMCENDTFLPKPGPLPQTSQTEATAASISRMGKVCQRLIRRRLKHQHGTEAACEAYLTPRLPRELPWDYIRLAVCPNVGPRSYAGPRDHAARSFDPGAG